MTEIIPFLIFIVPYIVAVIFGFGVGLSLGLWKRGKKEAMCDICKDTKGQKKVIRGVVYHLCDGCYLNVLRSLVETPKRLDKSIVITNP